MAPPPHRTAQSAASRPSKNAASSGCSFLRLAVTSVCQNAFPVAGRWLTCSADSPKVASRCLASRGVSAAVAAFVGSRISCRLNCSSAPT